MVEMVEMEMVEMVEMEMEMARDGDVEMLFYFEREGSVFNHNDFTHPAAARK